MIEAFDNHMATIFLSSWAIYLDESMSIWNNRWKCPDWIFCWRKTHPFGNEYHTACCALSDILFVIKIIEGKDCPRDLGRQEFDNLGGKTVGLLLRMLKSYFATGKYVILDLGFCVLKGLIELRKRELFACALIKKHHYWPINVPGNKIDRVFAEDGVKMSDTNDVQGVQDSITYNLWGMKEPNYVMKVMVTGGSLLSNNSCKEAVHKWVEDGVKVVKKFRYALPFNWHFRYCHAVDDHNNLHHHTPSIEETCKTDRWEYCVFAFIIALSKVKSFLAIRFFKKPPEMPTLVIF
mmetsp:Transcript_19630/g.42045  ORF Transcript_19630/g.42045 Transcript_19630/m.42045 type:complete len:293 (+) Transcript_19630:2219-3097(+)